jgi:RND family efflux transporter MFP subunit
VRNLLTAVVVLVVGLLITVLLVKLNNKPERVTPPASRPVVTAFTVTAEMEPVHVQSFGSVKAKRSVTIVPQVSGEVVAKSAAFEAGGFVKAGQVLLRVDDTDYALAVANARATVAQAEYNLAMAQEEAAVAGQEWDRMDRAGEPSPLVLREPQLKLAAANLKAAEAALAQAEVNLARCTMTAPFDGRVLNSDVDVGQYLRAGAAIGTVYATALAEITVSVPDTDLDWLNVGTGDDRAGATVDVSVEFGGTRHHWIGHAMRFGGAVDARSRLVPVVIEVANPYRSDGNRPPLVEGMFVEVTFNTLPQPGSVTVPRTAVRPGDKVWVIGEGNKLDIRSVTVARAGVNLAVLSDGLALGERICTSNLQYVTQGLPVRVEGDPLPAADQQPSTARDGAK